MAITILIDYTLCISLGIGIGVLASWIYHTRKYKTKVIGHIIETAMIERNVLELEVLSKHLNQIVSRIQECNDDLSEKILNMQDIEFSLSSYPELKKSIENLDSFLDPDVLEKNK
jgi:ferritin-like protein